MGFEKDITVILNAVNAECQKRQNVLLSATLTEGELKRSWGADAMGAPLIGNGQTAFSALHAHYQGPGRQAGPPFGFA